MLKRVLFIGTQCLFAVSVSAQLGGKYEQFNDDSTLSYNHISLNFKDSMFQYNEIHCLGEDFGAGTYQINKDTLVLRFTNSDSLLDIQYSENGNTNIREYQIIVSDIKTHKVHTIDTLWVLDENNNILALHYSLKGTTIPVSKIASKVRFCSKRMYFNVGLKTDQKSYSLYMLIPYFYIYNEREIKRYLIRNQTKESFELADVQYIDLLPKYNIFTKFIRK